MTKASRPGITHCCSANVGPATVSQPDRSCRCRDDVVGSLRQPPPCSRASCSSLAYAAPRGPRRDETTAMYPPTCCLSRTETLSSPNWALCFSVQPRCFITRTTHRLCIFTHVWATIVARSYWPQLNHQLEGLPTTSSQLNSSFVSTNCGQQLLPESLGFNPTISHQPHQLTRNHQVSHKGFSLLLSLFRDSSTEVQGVQARPSNYSSSRLFGNLYYSYSEL